MKKLRADISALKQRGASLIGSGKVEEAEQVFRIACDTDDQDPEAWFNLGAIHGMLGKMESAERYLRKAVSIDPGLPAANFNLGIALKSQGKLVEASACYRKAIDYEPDNAIFHYSLGNILLEMGNLDKAVDSFYKASALSPDTADYHYTLGNALKIRGLRHDAINAYLKALDLQPGYTRIHKELGSAYLSLGYLHSAEQCFERVLHDAPDDAEAISGMATALARAHKFQQAYAMLKPHISKPPYNAYVTIAFAGISRYVGMEEEAISMLETILRNNDNLGTDNRAQVHFRLGHFYDKKKAYNTAFHHFKKANSLRRPKSRPDSYKDTVDAIISSFSPDFFQQTARSTNASGLPVFIVGMPRSGTTLVEQILASHPDVYGAGELDALPSLLSSIPALTGTQNIYPDSLARISQQLMDNLASRYIEDISRLAPGAKRITDKMPGNFLNLGFINMLFPGARIIHCRRNPLDTCLSCYFQDFAGHQPYVTDLRSLGSFYLQYHRLMKHWSEVLDIQPLVVDYEDLVENFESVCKRLASFCNLEWSQSCLEFYRHDRVVVTASLDQVRMPLYKSSVGRWKNYREFIGPLEKILTMTDIP